MPILRSYLWCRLSLPGLVAFVLLLLLLGVLRLARALAAAAAADGPLYPLLAVWFLKLVAKCELLLPAAFFLGLLYALSRLAQDGELVACGVAGWGRRARLRAACGVALPAALLSVLLGVYVAPRAEAAAAHYLRLARSVAAPGVLRPGEFQHLGEGVLYLERVGADGLLRGVRLYLDGDPPALVVAESARVHGASWAGGHLLEFRAGTEYLGLPGDGPLRVSRFGVYRTRLQAAALEAPVKPGAPTRTQWQWRLAPGVSCLVLALLAVALVPPLPGARWYPRLLAGIALFLLYHNSLVVGHLLLKQGRLAPLPGLWAVHALFAAGAALFLAAPFGGRQVRLPGRGGS